MSGNYLLSSSVSCCAATAEASFAYACGAEHFNIFNVKMLQYHVTPVATVQA
jgi:hypothetical protein